MANLRDAVLYMRIIVGIHVVMWSDAKGLGGVYGTQGFL